MNKNTMTKNTVTLQQLYIQRCASYVDGIRNTLKHYDGFSQVAYVQKVANEGFVEIQKELHKVYAFTPTIRILDLVYALVESKERT